jgi:MFS family permease
MLLSIPKVKLKLFLNGAFASFGLYFCMYAFRKPFSVATFDGQYFLGIDYKIVLILAQVVGYMLSKFIGIRVVSGLKSQHRIAYLTVMILFAELTLILFGLVPKPYNFIMFFFNGLSLGMIWGIVFSYLEGRKTTEILSIILCSSFIVSSGVVKSVGLWLMKTHAISEFWMPAATGAMFLIPFFGCLYFLRNLPPPTAEDIHLRKKRRPMCGADRKKVLLQFFFPIIILVLFYTALTALRDFRDNFSRELWDSLGYAGDASIYTISELPIAFLVLLILGLFGAVKSNFKAFIGFHYLLVFASMLVGFSTLLFQQGVLSPVYWMILSGFGLYACYVPFNCIFFDRMIATFKIEGNSSYLIYIADSFGYLGSMAVLLYKNFGKPNSSWLQFFMGSTYCIAFLGVGVSVVSMLYYQKKYRSNSASFEIKITMVNG